MTDDAAEFFEERAAVAEYLGGLPRPDAEAMAMRLVRERYGEEVAVEIAMGGRDGEAQER